MKDFEEVRDMPEFREIVTKAVVGKARKFVQTNCTIEPTEEIQIPLSCVLGVWAINSVIDDEKIRRVGENIIIPFSFQVDVWVAFDDNKQTVRLSKNFSGEDTVKVKICDDDILDPELDIRVTVIQHPNASEATIINDCREVCVVVEREYVVELLGNTKICIQVFPGACDSNLDVTDFESEKLSADCLDDANDLDGAINPSFISEDE